MHTLTDAQTRTRMHACTHAHLIHNMSIHFVSDNQFPSRLCFAKIAGKQEAVQVVLHT